MTDHTETPTTPTRAEREDAIWAAYDRAVAPAEDAYERALAPARDARDRAIAPARAALDASLEALEMEGQ